MLDALRGVAAMIVLIIHFRGSIYRWSFDGIGWHGHLAVDLFFMLSGFVLGYAYNPQRWENMTVWSFTKRRIIRLHPLLLLGTLIGVPVFIHLGMSTWDGQPISSGRLSLSALSHALMIPALKDSVLDIRNDGSVFPLNGSMWSLFFEYIGSLLFGLLLRKLSTLWLGFATAIFGLVSLYAASFPILGEYLISPGPSFEGLCFPIALCRFLFAFCIGLLLCRVHKPLTIRGGFWIACGLLLLVCSMPKFSTPTNPALDGLYDVACVVLIFPVVIWIGASAEPRHPFAASLCTFLGAISYPLYALHAPLNYWFTDLIFWRKIPHGDAWVIAVIFMTACIAVAWLALKYYDEPLRRRLNKR